MKKIKVVVPVTTDMWNELVNIEMSAFKEACTAISVTNLARGTISIDDSFDVAWSGPFILREVCRAESDGFDGVIIYCFDDPAVRAAKEAVRIPVVGIGEASIHVASLIGHKFGIVTGGTEHKTGAVVWDNMRLLEMDHKCVGVKPVGVPVLRLKDDVELAKHNLKLIASELLAKNAEVIILGCGSMMGIADSVSKEIRIPIIVPARAAIKVCESLISMGLAQSKKGFATPLDKQRID